MQQQFDFKDFFIFDMANNHQGNLEHGLNIIRAAGRVARENEIRVGLKFQLRELSTFIHPSYKDAIENKHIQRFLSTQLTQDEFATMTEEVRHLGLTTIATPFDEPSVDFLCNLGIEVIKIASCSADDWPLLEKIALCGKPVVISTGGLTLEKVDGLLTYLEHRRVNFAYMHCVAIYPTPDEKMQLNQISLLKKRFPEIPVGFSTHENPNDLSPIQIAVATGAEIFERHIGLETDSIKLNAYSSTPEQLNRWIQSYKRVKSLLGDANRPPTSEEEATSLESLKRGVYAKCDIEEGSTIKRDDIFFAIPLQEGQIRSGEFRTDIIANIGTKEGYPLMSLDVQFGDHREKQILFDTIQAVKGILNEGGIALAPDFTLEFSHHYGLESFKEFGAVIIDVVNRKYCKKLIVQLPGQKHPNHFHKQKEETFQVLHGCLEIIVDDRRRTLLPGDTVLIHQGVWHEFWTKTGVVFEEISTTHVNDDSFYEDKTINNVERSTRKTIVNHWGRYQI